MTTAQERIAIAIGNFAHAMETNSTGSTKLRLETREELHALFAELAAERDAAVGKCAELLAAAKGVAIIDCDPFAQGGMAAELRLRKAIAAAEQGGA